MEVSTVVEAYFQMLLKLCDNQVDVSYLCTVLGLFHFAAYCYQCKVNLKVIGQVFYFMIFSYGNIRKKGITFANYSY